MMFGPSLVKWKIIEFFTIYSCPNRTSLREKNVFSFAPLRIRQEWFLWFRGYVFETQDTNIFFGRNTIHPCEGFQYNLCGLPLEARHLVCYNRAWCARILRSRNIVFMDFEIHQEVCLNNSWLKACDLIMIVYTTS